jgi:hypothetical protein
VFGGQVQGVEVAGGSGAESGRQILLLALQGAGRSWTAVLAQDLLEQLGRGAKVNVVRYRSTPEPGWTWLWSCRRPPARWRAAGARRRCTWHGPTRLGTRQGRNGIRQVNVTCDSVAMGGRPPTSIEAIQLAQQAAAPTTSTFRWSAPPFGHRRPARRCGRRYPARRQDQRAGGVVRRGGRGWRRLRPGR